MLTVLVQDTDTIVKRSLRINLPGPWERFTTSPTQGEVLLSMSTLLERLVQYCETTVIQVEEAR